MKANLPRGESVTLEKHSRFEAKRKMKWFIEYFTFTIFCFFLLLVWMACLLFRKKMLSRRLSYFKWWSAVGPWSPGTSKEQWWWNPRIRERISIIIISWLIPSLTSSQRWDHMIYWMIARGWYAGPAVSFTASGIKTTVKKAPTNLASIRDTELLHFIIVS